jgi:hypothetical protein
MLKAFLFVFNPIGPSRQTVLDHLDTCREVKNWFAFFSNSIFIISDHTVHELTAAVRKGLPQLQMVITEVPKGANNGWLDKKVWDFINNPKSSGRWPS